MQRTAFLVRGGAIALALSLVVLAGCSAKFDGSSPEAMDVSMRKVEAEVPPERRLQYMGDLGSVVANSGMTHEQLRKVLDGKTAEDVHKMAEELRKQSGRSQ